MAALFEDTELDALLNAAAQNLKSQENKKQPKPSLMRFPSLDSGLKIKENLYIETKKKGVSKMKNTAVALEDDDASAEQTKALEKLPTRKLLKAELPTRKELAKEKEKTAGAKWFDMPAPDITDELKRDLTLIKLRNVLDPKRHYKKDNSKELPKYFQVGTIIEGAGEFYSARLTRRERKETILGELMADTDSKRYFKRKFLEVQETKQAGGRKHFKKRFKKRD
ncbi:Fcf2-domain-containing protein [Basidiobolus meristosporus CBS 931.73]|uniref:Fcf2-domain-containing protein n=1 Tax=Basidiobolus meristosporus CBS 931.73 TaxID=1314790 RepID=A0A1Y1Y0L7_9FUNG|nr:Fcf2-domain-containing protein [Basidiobolus meristosporus CBS 931.73]|eukprot:ORX91174.1 Fcf2-domain-containing protein [Basidiobolus meristosporus CBS 931.73]